MAMTTFIRAALERCATWRVAAAALAGIVACLAGLVWRQHRLGGLELLDSRAWYTPGEAAALFDDLDRLDATARLVYAVTGLTIDMVFPAAYGLFLAILLFRLFRGLVPLFLLPLAMAAADVLENMTVAGLALSHAGAPSPVSWLAATFTLVKTVLIAATAVALAIGIVRWLWTRLRR